MKLKEYFFAGRPHFSLKGTMSHELFMQAAIDQANLGLREGGLPIGCVLVIGGEIVGRGRNRRIQMGSVIHHAEMDCLERVGRLLHADYRRATIYTTLSPCDMCSGAILLYKIPHVVIGENQNFSGPEDYLRSRGVILEVMQSSECVKLLRDCIAQHPDLWQEDIGEP